MPQKKSAAPKRAPSRKVRPAGSGPAGVKKSKTIKKTVTKPKEDVSDSSVSADPSQKTVLSAGAGASRTVAPSGKSTSVQGKTAMEEALKDLDRMMSSEDSAYRLGSAEEDVQDYGMGVGDLLGSAGKGAVADSGEDRSPADEPTSGRGKLSVESILQGDDYDDYGDDAEEEASATIVQPKRRNKGSKILLVVPILVFVLALLLVAEGLGMFGGAGRRWSTAVLSGLKTRFTPSEVQPASDTRRSDIPSVVSVNLLVAADRPVQEGSLPTIVSRVIETDVQLQDTFAATGEAVSDEARSVGTITVVNDTSRAFHFVPSTRFLSEDGVLFRLKKAADVPADGTVDVEVYADETGPSGDIGPSRFTIPGLSADLQTGVYGRSGAEMTGGSGTVVAVSAEDLAAAKDELLTRLRTEAIDNFSLMLDQGESVVGDLITSRELDAVEPEEGTPGATFSLTLSVEFRALVVPEDDIVSLMRDRLVEMLPADANVGDYEIGSPLYAVEAYDTVGERAELRVESSVRPY
ncbi:MAG: hypothetical protein ABIJ46_01725 [bacterium]